MGRSHLEIAKMEDQRTDLKMGTVQVYTGEGKGKTTAALGQALRAVGHGQKVIVIQFMKGQINYGELRAAEGIPGLEIEQYGLPTFVERGNPSTEDREWARKGMERAREVVKEARWDMVVLDEINVAVDYGLIDLDEVIDLIKARPPEMELVLTGRYATEEVIELADLVTEMKEIKHHYQKGIQAREGIEF